MRKIIVSCANQITHAAVQFNLAAQAGHIVNIIAKEYGFKGRMLIQVASEDHTNLQLRDAGRTKIRGTKRDGI